MPPEFVATDYIQEISTYELVGGAVVFGSFQAFDQDYLIDALSMLGDVFVGVANIPNTMSARELTQSDK
ncbi:amidohydrolase family protein [Sphingobacterium chungjuense]|uniref:hypothetical protein n=1 Tax=Sphingobacterium chungjuense TaxID=2675553 RepID=UPI00140BAAC3|nr:hypothetical protein [Sphingobacterium chungjuense]